MTSGSNTPALVTVQAKSATTFVDGIGINTHVDFNWTSYNNFAEVENALSYIGVTTVRDSIDNPADPQKFNELNAALGIKFDFFISPGSAGFTQQLEWLQSNASIIADLEGPNESDNWPQTYDNLTGLAATESEQQALEAARAQYANLAGIPLIQSSFGQLGTFANVSGIGSDATYANAHVYFGTHNNPGDNSWIQTVEGLAKGITPSAPLVVTETGYETMDTNSAGVDDTVQAKYDLDDLFDEWQSGATEVDLYELVDQEADPSNLNSEYHFGVFNADFTPKPAAIALHNLMSILNSTSGATGPSTPQTLAYSVTNLPSTGNSELFQKTDGTFVLALWNDVRLESATSEADIIVPNVAVTLNLGQSFAYIDVFDPLSGSSPIAVFNNASQINIALPDHPLLIELSQSALPRIATGPTMAAPARLVTTASNKVQVDGLAITDPASGTETVDIGDANGTLSYTDAAGTVHSGKSLDITGTKAAVNADLATMQYTGASSTGSDTVSVYTMDGAGLSSSQSIAVTVDADPGAPVDTGPVLSLPASEIVGRSTATAVSGIVLTDAYGSYNPGSLYLNVSDSHGTLAMKNWAGNTVAGSGTSSVTYQASFIDVAAALASLTYMSTGAVGNDTITIIIYDQIGMSTVRTIAADVSATAPVVTAPVVTAPVVTAPVVTAPVATPTAPATVATVSASTSSTTTPATVSAAAVASTGVAYAISTPAVSPIVTGQAMSNGLWVSGASSTVIVGTDESENVVQGFKPGAYGDTLTLAGASSASVGLSDYKLDDIVWDMGTFAPVAWSMDGSAVTNSTFLGGAMPEGWSLGAMGDFAGNGVSDILWTPTTPGGTAYLWMTTPTGETGVSLAQYGVVSSKAWTGDFNEDGKTDILWDFGSSAPVLWTMDGATVTSSTFFGINMPQGYQIGGVGDFNGDGTSDILWLPTTSGAGPAYLWLTDPGGNGVTGYNLGAYGAVPDEAWVGDFNGDGKSDILLDFGSTTVLWTMNGAVVTGASFYGTTMPPGWSIAGVGDFSGDGRTDVLWTNPLGGAYLWMNTAAGVAGVSLANYGLVPGKALVGNLTLAGTKVDYGTDSQAILQGVDKRTLTSNNIVASPSTLDHSAASAGVTVNLATGYDSTGSSLAGIQAVVGSAYNDVLEGHGVSAASTLTGNGGYDTYLYAATDGQVAINNGVAGLEYASGALDFTGGLTDQNLWFVQSGNNLVVDVLGTSDQLTVNNWYANAHSQIAEVTAGSLKLDTQLATLVQAMATYAGAHTSFDPQASAAMPTDATLQTTIAAAWHN